MVIADQFRLAAAISFAGDECVGIRRHYERAALLSGESGAVVVAALVLLK